jgi:hypothetical protein
MKAHEMIKTVNDFLCGGGIRTKNRKKEKEGIGGNARISCQYLMLGFHFRGATECLIIENGDEKRIKLSFRSDTKIKSVIVAEYRGERMEDEKRKSMQKKQ